MSPSTARHSLTDFVNLKIKAAQFFKGAYKGRICVRIFIEIVLIYVSVSASVIPKKGIMPLFMA
jgi:hypothetical protein